MRDVSLERRPREDGDQIASKDRRRLDETGRWGAGQVLGGLAVEKSRICTLVFPRFAVVSSILGG